jgi:hypothetical protein
MGSKPTHEQAQLHLQVYDQRREAKLRQARDWFGKNYMVNNIDDAMRIAPMGSETGAYVGMVIGYWERACALLNYGLLYEDLGIRAGTKRHSRLFGKRLFDGQRFPTFGSTIFVPLMPRG